MLMTEHTIVGPRLPYQHESLSNLIASLILPITDYQYSNDIIVLNFELSEGICHFWNILIGYLKQNC